MQAQWAIRLYGLIDKLDYTINGTSTKVAPNLTTMSCLLPRAAR